MSNLIQAAQQALEALEKIHAHPNSFWGCSDDITALRAALAEPDWQDLYLKEKKRADMWRDKYESVAGAEQRIHPLAEPVQEPVAVVRSVVSRGEDGVNIKWLRGFPQIGTKLFTTPPQRKPLTEEEIINIGKEARAVEGPHILPVSFARAIEQAHGIKE